MLSRIRAAAPSWGHGSSMARRWLGGTPPARAQLSMTRTRLPTMARFNGSTVQQLQDWLEEHGVDTSGYGLGVSKTVSDLMEESQNKESVLEIESGGQAVRIVRVLSLHIVNKEGQILFEEEQILPDGRSRRRNVALSEKLVGDEQWRAAIARAVREELGSVLPEEYEVSIFDNTYKLLSHESQSMSYPNLPTKYLFHRVRVSVSGLPPGPFSTTEERTGGQLVTRWVWKYEEEVPCDICAPPN